MVRGRSTHAEKNALFFAKVSDSNDGRAVYQDDDGAQKNRSEGDGPLGAPASFLLAYSSPYETHSLTCRSKTMKKTVGAVDALAQLFQIPVNSTRGMEISIKKKKCAGNVKCLI
jgi:hypothetical protein